MVTTRQIQIYCYWAIGIIILSSHPTIYTFTYYVNLSFVQGGRTADLALFRHRLYVIVSTTGPGRIDAAQPPRPHEVETCSAVV